MDIRLRICLLCSIDEFGHKVVVRLSASSGPLETKVEVASKKLLVVGSAVQDNGKSSSRIYSRAESVQDQLRNGDQDPSNALITDAQDQLKRQTTS